MRPVNQAQVLDSVVWTVIQHDPVLEENLKCS